MSLYSLEIKTGAERFALLAPGDKSILEILRGCAPEYLSAPCGGKGRCGKCAVSVRGRVRRLSDGAELELAGESLLSCGHAPAGALFIELPEKSAMYIPAPAEEDIPGGGAGLGLAVDIGSTTVAAALFELESGKRLALRREENAQRPFGADVLSRVELSRNGGRAGLSEALQSQLARLGRSLLAECGGERIDRCVLAGNTIMEHFASGLDPGGIARPPFEGESLFGAVLPPPGPLSELLGAAELYFAPCVSGYVGGDVTAGLMASGALEAEGLWLYVDVGTNGEIALGDKNGFLCCATAAGPAFEGAELSCGMDASPGAIHRVTVSEGLPRPAVIGGGEAVGICGSGVIDAAAAALKLRLIGRSGRISPAERLPEELRCFIGESGGKRAIVLAPGVLLDSADIRNIQLAKAAIRAGTETLLEAAGKSAADISRLVVAGGFGSFIDPESAFAIGLLPPAAPRRVSAVGNASLRGAALALSARGRGELEKTAALCRYIDLSASPDFSKHYLQQLNF